MRYAPRHWLVRRAPTPWAAFAAAGLVLAAAMCSGAEPGVLVLKNGNVLQGGVERQTDYYRVDLEGASFRVPLDQVEISAASLSEAYETRRKQRAGWSADSHVDLAGWCLRNNLPLQAAREILDVRTADPGNPAIRQLELQLAQQLVGANGEAKTQAAGEPSPTVQQQPSAPRAEPVDVPALDATEQAQFVRNIQPMLINSCATGGCHHTAGREPMRLDRWALDGRGDPDIVRRNLAEVLAMIDRDAPAESPLVRQSRRPHGGVSPRDQSRPLDARQEAILKFWLDEVCDVAPEPAEVAPAAYDADDELGYEASDALDDEAGREPADPFDPAIFNRRVREPAEGAAASTDSSAEPAAR